MTGLGAESKALLEAARPGDEPTIADRERVRAALAAGLALAASSELSAAAAARSSAVATFQGGAAIKALAAFGLVCVVGASAIRLTRTVVRPATSPMVTGAAAESGAGAAETLNVVTRLLPPSVRAETPAPVHPYARSAATPAPSSARSGQRTSNVAAEVRLLGEAQAAIRGGYPERALTLLDQHERQFPKGALGEERDAARIGALCALGRTAEARAATDRFLRAAPHSPQAGPVRSSCGGSGTPASAP